MHHVYIPPLLIYACITHFPLTPLTPPPPHPHPTPPHPKARKKDTGVMYALKVLDKQILASRSRRWQLHASRELACLKVLN